MVQQRMPSTSSVRRTANGGVSDQERRAANYERNAIY